MKWFSVLYTTTLIYDCQEKRTEREKKKEGKKEGKGLLSESTTRTERIRDKEREGEKGSERVCHTCSCGGKGEASFSSMITWPEGRWS